MGFEKEREYTVFFAWFIETANLAVNGNMCFRRQEYADATAWYDRAFETGEGPVWAYWNAARVNAVIGRREAALTYLRRAVEKGFTDVASIKGSDHLRGLHMTEEWRELVTALERDEAV